jgi:glyoxylase-like metal-dependent hydrolase (beta-lactamase superfamily II)
MNNRSRTPVRIALVPWLFASSFVLGCAHTSPPTDPKLAPALPTLAESSTAGPAAGESVRDTVSTKLRSTVEVAAGVYVIRHEDAPDAFPQGNTTVVVGAREVLVVDSCYLPSSARKDIEQIRAWTDKPVRYLVNTHWHYDHTMGNGVYQDAFPNLSVVAHKETRKQIAGYNPQWFERFPERATFFQKAIEEGKVNDVPLTAGELEEYKSALTGVEPVWTEFKELVHRTDLAPTLDFERELTIDLGNREVRLLHLGRGNTAGDAIVYLPQEKVVVTGDLLVHPIPYLAGGYPVELIATLEALRHLDAQVFVPGHGTVLRGSSYLDLVTSFVREVVALVDDEVKRLGNSSRKLDEVKEKVRTALPLAAWSDRFAGDDGEAKDFFEHFALDGLITAAYASLWPR